MKLDRILVGVDFSESCRVAVDAARGLALRANAELLLVHVIKEPDWPAELEWTWPRKAEDYEQRLATHLTVRKRQLEELKEEIATEGLKITRVHMDGVPGWSLVQAATEMHADLVVVGSRGMSGMTRLLVGSVAERVARRCTVPVLVARGPGAPAGSYRKVMVGTDFSEPAVRAMAWSRTLAAEDGEVDIVHCWKAPTWLEPGDASPPQEQTLVGSALEEQLQEHGKSWIVAQRGPETAMGFHMIARTPLRGLLDWIEEHHSDLVVIGSHGHEVEMRPRLGSVATAILRHASCSVLISR